MKSLLRRFITLGFSVSFLSCGIGVNQKGGVENGLVYEPDTSIKVISTSSVPLVNESTVTPTTVSPSTVTPTTVAPNGVEESEFAKHCKKTMDSSFANASIYEQVMNGQLNADQYRIWKTGEVRKVSVDGVMTEICMVPVQYIRTIGSPRIETNSQLATLMVSTACALLRDDSGNYGRVVYTNGDSGNPFLFTENQIKRKGNHTNGYGGRSDVIASGSYQVQGAFPNYASYCVSRNMVKCRVTSTLTAYVSRIGCIF